MGQTSVNVEWNKLETLLNELVEKLGPRMGGGFDGSRKHKDLIARGAIIFALCGGKNPLSRQFENDDLGDAIKTRRTDMNDFLRHCLTYQNRINEHATIKQIKRGRPVAEDFVERIEQFLRENLELEHVDIRSAPEPAPSSSSPPGKNAERIRNESEIAGKAVDYLRGRLEEWPALSDEIKRRSRRDDAVEALLEFPDLYSLLNDADRSLYESVRKCLESLIKDSREFDRCWILAKEILGSLCLLELNPDWLIPAAKQALPEGPILEVSVQSRFGVEVVRAGRWGGHPKYEDLTKRPRDIAGQDAISFDPDADEPGLDTDRAINTVQRCVWKKVFPLPRDELQDSDFPLQDSELTDLNTSLREDRLRRIFHHVPLNIEKENTSPMSIEPVRAMVAKTLPELPVILWGGKAVPAESRVFKGADEHGTKSAVASFLLLKSELLKSRDAQ